MITLTQPLRDEHKELFPSVNRILRVADRIGEAPTAEIREGVGEVYEFLAYHLNPHAQAEEAALYPVVQKVLSSPEATRTMSRDHLEIGRYIEELEALTKNWGKASLTAEQRKALQRLLYGAYALIKVHFAKEEEIYLPILDQRLTPTSAQEMFQAMETAADKAKHLAHI